LEKVFNKNRLLLMEIFPVWRAGAFSAGDDKDVIDHQKGQKKEGLLQAALKKQIGAVSHDEHNDSQLNYGAGFGHD
jgi:hypothetical protein